MPDDAGEKRLPASPQKRRRAREDGKVARSQDLTSAVALLVALIGLRYLGPWIFSRLVALTAHFFGNVNSMLPEVGNVQALAMETLWLTTPTILPFMLLMLAIGLTINILQVGLLFTGKPLIPDLKKLNPFTGFANFFSLRAFVELIKSILKVSLLTYVVWLTVRDRLDEVVNLMALTPLTLTPAIGALIVTVWWRLTLVLLILGILDYGFQRWQYEQNLMMTVRETQEEMKEFEGDPQIKRRVRSIQRQMAMRRMMADVPKADVIITNPVRYAIALRYDASSMAAPVVIAKGARLLAERIRDLAIEHDVPIVEKPELARTLYRTIEVGQPVPENLFRAVAEVLAYVYRIDRRIEKVRERAGWDASAIAA